ncbi:hypothetical protein PGB90_008654 [Kerria lacca]
MEDNINEIEKIKGYTALQFIKGHEATIEVFKRLKECVQMNITQHSQLNTSNVYCPLVFDGWTCWNTTPAGTTSVNQCPNFITGFDPHRTAFRECDSNGSWFIHPDTGQPWSNYSTCIDFEDLEVIFSLFAFYESRC